jgi:MFS transporter, DHA2 family, multidrug resistance protein
MDYTPAQAGYAVLPGALGMALTTPWAGRLADKIDRRYVVLGGLTLFALASYWFSFITLDHSMDRVIWMIVGRYITIGFIFTPINAASMMLLPSDKVRMGAGLINIMQQGIGGTVGLAMMTTMLERRTMYHTSMLAQQQVSSPIEWGDSPTATSIFDLSTATQYADPVDTTHDQEAAHVTCLSDRRRRLCHSHV